MKKTFLPVLLALVIPVMSVAQNAIVVEKNKGYIALGIGAAVPVGKFGSNTDEEGGLAQTGLSYDISFAYNFNPHIGIAAAFTGMSNSIDEDYFNDVIGSFLIPGMTYKMNAESWKTNFFLGGMNFSFPVKDKTSFYLRALAGIAIGESPAITITTTYNGSSEWSAQTSGNGSGFAYLAGAGFKVDLNLKLCLLLHADYMGTTISFDGIENTDSMGGYETNSFEQNIAVFNLGAGIGIRL